jgi:hypothetical protein
MLTNRRGKVLFIGPAFATKWMGRGVSHAAMANIGFRLARIEDTKYMNQDDLDQIQNEQPIAVIAPLPAIVVEVKAVEVAAEEVDEYPLEYEQEEEPKQRRKRITKNKKDAY